MSYMNVEQQISFVVPIIALMYDQLATKHHPMIDIYTDRDIFHTHS